MNNIARNKPTPSKFCFRLTKVLALSLGIAATSMSAHAASGNWVGGTSAVWDLDANWSAAPFPGAGDTATFNAASGNTTIDLTGGVAAASIVFDTASAAAYTIGSGGAGAQSLTLGASVALNATVATSQLFNSNILLGADGAVATYTVTNSATAVSGVALNFAGTIQGGPAGTAGLKTLNIAGTGGVNISGAISAGGGTNVDVAVTGTNTATFSGSATSTVGALRSSTGGGKILVNGMNITSASSSSYGNVASLFEIQSGSVAFNGGITSGTSSGQPVGADGQTFRVTGGTFSASTVSMGRSQTITGLQTNPTVTAGFIVTGGTATVTGNVNLAGSNSSVGSLVSGGSLTVGGEYIISNSTAPNSGRYSLLQVSGGTFTNTDTVTGISLARNAATGGQGEFLVTGGVSTVEKISFGLSTSATTGANTSNGALVLGNATNGGALYIGSGGIVKGAIANYTATINLVNGILGAKAAWSSSLAMTLAGTATTIKAADASNVANDITLSGSLSGTGGFTKTGGGTLNITGTANTYSGVTTVSAGTLSTGSGANLGAGNVTLTGTSTLTLGSTVSFADSAILTFVSGTGTGNTINMSFAGTDTLAGITDGVTSAVTGTTYTAASLNTLFGGNNFNGGGSFLVVPEPNTWAMLLAGVGVLTTFQRSRRGLGALKR